MKTSLCLGLYNHSLSILQRHSVGGLYFHYLNKSSLHPRHHKPLTNISDIVHLPSGEPPLPSTLKELDSHFYFGLPRPEYDENHNSHFILLKSYINTSGPQLTRALKENKFFPSDLIPSNLIVFQDDLETPFGEWRLKTQGSANGHNGIKSLIQELETDVFTRVKIGIGRPSSRVPSDIRNYVLADFEPEEISYLLSDVFPDITQRIFDSDFQVKNFL